MQRFLQLAADVAELVQAHRVVRGGDQEPGGVGRDRSRTRGGGVGVWMRMRWMARRHGAAAGFVIEQLDQQFERHGAIS